jgi:hypothetical protein
MRRVPAGLRALIAANAPLWGGEAEVIATYFASSRRSAANDAAWLARQCYKEIVDGTVGRLDQLTRNETDFERTVASAGAALADEGVRVELKHYVAFAIAYRACAAAAHHPIVTARIGTDWPENVELQSMRAKHRYDFGPIGERAAAFTEGGYCTLYRAGMALAGGTALDDAIAAACAQVFEDELDHMLGGIAGLADAAFDADEWVLLERLTVAQGRGRIRMRNAQFGLPLSAARITELEAGRAEPVDFDYARAGFDV